MGIEPFLLRIAGLARGRAEHVPQPRNVFERRDAAEWPHPCFVRSDLHQLQ
jgi:hypothetical protein